MNLIELIDFILQENLRFSDVSKGQRKGALGTNVLILIALLNSFVPNVPFLYPMKTSEKHKVFWFFQGVEKGCIGNEWVNASGVSHTTVLWYYLKKLLQISDNQSGA